MIPVSRDADQVLDKGCRMAGHRQYPCGSTETMSLTNARPGRGLQVDGNPGDVTSSRGTQDSGVCLPCSDAPRGESRRGPDARPDGSLRSKDDRLVAEAGRPTTCGNSRRQDSGPQVGSDDGNWRGGRRPRSQFDPSKSKLENRLTAINGRPTTAATHSYALMRSGSGSRKASVNTTKNDNMQNQRHHRQLWQSPARALIPVRGTSAFDFCAAEKNSMTGRSTGLFDQLADCLVK